MKLYTTEIWNVKISYSTVINLPLHSLHTPLLIHTQKLIHHQKGRIYVLPKFYQFSCQPKILSNKGKKKYTPYNMLLL